MYGSLSVVLLLGVALLTLTSAQPPPPTIAEFAPQALEVIDDAPSEQSSQFGRRGVGDCPPGAEVCFDADGTPIVSGPGATPPPIEVSRVRRCVGDPPRQIEDPQSPPCVPYWKGDNGGATSKGVYPDEIRIGIDVGGRFGAQYAGFFNSRFEFYGRRITFRGPPWADRCDTNRAAAAELDAAGVFAMLATNRAADTCFYDELARRKVISAQMLPMSSEADLAKKHPYMWQYTMSYDEILANLGRWACSLAGQDAIYSNDPLLAEEPRKFGAVVQEDTRATAFSTEALHREMGRCGESVREVRITKEDSDTGNARAAGDPTPATNAMLDFKTEGVSTVFCICFVFMAQHVASAASSQEYYPEWIMSTLFGFDTSGAMKIFWADAAQRQSVFGLSFNPRMVALQDDPVWWALREADPTAEFNGVGQYYDAMKLYRSLLLVASGIQMAGPNLTPETFADALHRTRFPNPEHRIRAGAVGFQGGRHSMTMDAEQIWWSESAVPPNPYPQWEGTGTYCYVPGPRHRLNTWPSEPPALFDPPCEVGARP